MRNHDEKLTQAEWVDRIATAYESGVDDADRARRGLRALESALADLIRRCETPIDLIGPLNGRIGVDAVRAIGRTGLWEQGWLDDPPPRGEA